MKETKLGRRCEMPTVVFEGASVRLVWSEEVSGCTFFDTFTIERRRTDHMGAPAWIKWDYSQEEASDLLYVLKDEAGKFFLALQRAHVLGVK